MTKTKVDTNLDDEDLEALDGLRKTRGLSRSALIRMAVREYIDKETKERG